MVWKLQVAPWLPIEYDIGNMGTPSAPNPSQPLDSWDDASVEQSRFEIQWERIPKHKGQVWVLHRASAPHLRPCFGGAEADAWPHTEAQKPNMKFLTNGYQYLVVGWPSLKNIRQLGWLLYIIPNIWENNTSSKPLIRYGSSTFLDFWVWYWYIDVVVDYWLWLLIGCWLAVDGYQYDQFDVKKSAFNHFNRIFRYI